MNLTHRSRATGHARAWWSLLAVAALGAATALPGGVAADDPAPAVLLTGPLGTRSGVVVAAGQPLPDPALIAPLDTYGRDPRLRLWHEGDPETGDGWSSWEVVATSTGADPGEPRTLAAGDTDTPADSLSLTPPPPGDWLIGATLTRAASAQPETWAWHLTVPDRTIPESIPVPDLVVSGAGTTVVAERGGGCYLGACGDIGGRPPARAVPLVTLDLPDAPIALTLSDGSGIQSVTVSAESLDGSASAPLMLLDQADADGANVVFIPPPSSAGRWYLEVTVRFTDARGDTTGYARVAVPSPGQRV